MQIKLSKNFYQAFFLLVFAFVIYSPSLKSQPLLDDYSLILEDNRNHSFRFIQDQLRMSPFTDKHYRPVANIVIAGIYTFFKSHFEIYHVISVLLFWGFCWLAYQLIFLLVGDEFILSWPQNPAKNFGGDGSGSLKYSASETASQEGRSFIAFAATSLFCSHPLNVITAGYVTGAFMSLYGLFFLLTIMSCLQWIRTGAKIYIVGGMLSYGLSFLSHEVGLFLPLYLAVLLFYVGGNQKGRSWIFLLSMGAMAAGYLVWRMFWASLFGHVLKPLFTSNLSVMTYLSTFKALIYWYVSKLFIPFDITFIWNIGLFRQNGFALFVEYLFWLFFFIFMSIRYKSNRAVMIPLLYLIIGFLPAGLACVTMPYLGLIIEPHWFYFSSLGFFVLVAQLLNVLRERMRYPWRINVILAVLLIVYGGVTFSYNRLWHDEEAYARHWLKISPRNPSAAFYLASSLSRKDQEQEAKQFYLQSFIHTQSDSEVYVNLGLIEWEKGSKEKAQGYFRKALEIRPNSALAYNNLALSYKDTGEKGKAADYFQKAISLNKFLMEPRLNLAEIYRENGKSDLAIALYQQNLAINPLHEQSLFNLIQEYFQLKDIRQGKAGAEKLLSLTSSALLLTGLGSLCAQNNLVDLAQRCFLKALNQDDRYLPVYLELGKLLGNLEKWDEAVAIWQKGLRLSGGDQRFRDLIQQAQQFKAQAGPKMPTTE